MKLKFNVLILSVLTIVVMNSCHTQKLMVEVYTPSKIELPPDVRGILVTSRFVPATGEYEAVQWGYFESVDSAMWDLSRYYAESFSRALDTAARYISKTDFDIRMLRNNNDQLAEPLPWQGLTAALDKYGAAGIAILQGFKVDEGQIEFSEDPSDAENPITARKKIAVTGAWRISQPERRRVLDENIYTYSKDFSAKGKTREEAESNLPPHNIQLQEACDWAAKSCAANYIPGGELVERDYYNDGDTKLVEAHEAVLAGNWTKAETKWNYLAYQGENDEIKAKASYNMALMCEKDGRLNQALGYARKANKYLPHRRHLKLINELAAKVFLDEERRQRKEVIRNW